MMMRDQATSQPERALFICGSLNQTSQLLAVAKCLPELDAYFTPFYGGAFVQLAVQLGLADATIAGRKLAARSLARLQEAGVQLDVAGRNAPYDLVVTCTDLIDQPNLRGCPRVVVQEGMTDPETFVSKLVARARWLPVWLASTTLTATRGKYDRFCVASPGYRDLFIRRGAPAHKLRVTGIPNFDACEQQYAHNALPDRDFVLVCTSDMRETARRDDRPRFWRNALQIAKGRPLHVKFHPNENQTRARRELLAVCPDARVHETECTEELIANCAVLITQYSSVAFVGLALGKEVHSLFDVDDLRRLLPIQNGGSSAAQIAEVCRELLRERGAARSGSGTQPIAREVQSWAS